MSSQHLPALTGTASRVEQRRAALASAVAQTSSPSARAVSRFSRISCLTPRSRWPAAR